MNPKLSIIVCTYNGAKRVPQCLDALKRQKQHDLLEIIVVDDGSSDDTFAVITAALQDTTLPHIIIRHSVNKGLGQARNTGIEASSAPIVAFTDDDCVPPEDWAARLIAAWDNCAPDAFQALGGHVVPATTNTLNRKYAAVRTPLAPIEQVHATNASIVAKLFRYIAVPSNKPSTERRSVLSTVGANMSFSRKALDEVGGFNPDIRFGGDEVDICMRLRDRYGDNAVAIEPTLVMSHEFHPGLADTFRRARMYGEGDANTWHRQGGIPSLRPAPIFTAIASVLGLLISPGVSAAATVAVPVILWRNMIFSGIFPLTQRVMFPFIALIEESCNLAGFLLTTTKRALR